MTTCWKCGIDFDANSLAAAGVVGSCRKCTAQIQQVKAKAQIEASTPAPKEYLSPYITGAYTCSVVWSTTSFCIGNPSFADFKFTGYWSCRL